MPVHKFWKADMKGQASAASVASSVVRMFSFSVALLVEGPMWCCLICGDQEVENRTSILLVLTIVVVTWLS